MLLTDKLKHLLYINTDFSVLKRIYIDIVYIM